MILPDINVLLYAYNPSMPQYAKAKTWWENALNHEEAIGLPHEVTLGFVRIATNPRLKEASVPFDKAVAVVSSWLQTPNVHILLPDTDHAERVFELMRSSNASGTLTSDASLAVYAIRHRATLCSNDGDFARFPGLKWINPLLQTE